MENQIISINLIPNLSTPAVVRVSQYDVGRPLVFKVYDGTSPADLTGVTAVIEGTKKSGLGFSESGTVSDNTVTLDTTLAMTQEYGSIPAEIRFTKTGEDVGTANFILAVEKTPHAEGTTDGTTETMADLQSQLDALDERVETLEGGGGGLTEAVKSAMLQIAQKVAYIDEHGQTYYNALYNALYPPAELVSITAVYTQSGTVYDTDSLDSLKNDLVVTATFTDSTTGVINAEDYTLSGTLTEGTSTITVSYGGKTASFNVTVTHQNVPSGYTEYDYIYKSTSGDIKPIVTDAQLASDYTVEMRYKYPSGTYANSLSLFGTKSKQWGGSKEIALFITQSTGKLGYWYANTDTKNEIFISADTVHSIKVLPVGKSTTYPSNAVIDVDGTEYDTGSTASGETWSAWFGIFGYAYSATNTVAGADFSQIGEIIIKDANDDIVYDFVPVSRNDNKNGFYETVNDTFYEATSMTVGNWE